MRNRRTRLVTTALVPLSLLSGAWLAGIAGVGGAVVANASSVSGGKTHATLPGGEAVPSEAITAPASVPVAGAIAPSVPKGSADAVVTAASTSAIPVPALAAYQRGAQIIDAADTSCHLSWELIAAIGRVESDHGRYGGNTLSAAGVSVPGIYGPELNGKGSTAAISDTDQGVIDADPRFDRAVGPMQFIPSTWQVVKVDADGDGKRDPQDIDDASLATAVYLCSGGEDLATRKGQEAAVLRYNHSASYVGLVLRLMEAYQQGDYSAVPSGSYAGTTFVPSSSSVIAGSRQQAKTKAAKAAKGSKKAKAAHATTHVRATVQHGAGSAGHPVAPVPTTALSAAPAAPSPSGSALPASTPPSTLGAVPPTLALTPTAALPSAGPSPGAGGPTSSPACTTISDPALLSLLAAALAAAPGADTATAADLPFPTDLPSTTGVLPPEITATCVPVVAAATRTCLVADPALADELTRLGQCVAVLLREPVGTPTGPAPH